jgi:hypothetical protein
MDEENLDLQRYLPMATIRQHDLIWNDMNFLFAECEKHGARPWVWSDMYWLHPESYAANMSKAVLQSNWYYNVFSPSNQDKTAIKTYIDLDKLGFEQVPTVSTCFRANGRNSVQTLAFAKDKLTPELVKGFMTASWSVTTPEQEFELKNDAHALYVGRKMFYPETL